jgi:threonine/homoserine/homoserine lactone efflux protein
MVTLPFILFSLVASITPGPTNIIVLSLSARYGFWKALPVVIGGCMGAAVIVLVTGIGLGESLARYPAVQQVMGMAGILWLTYLAWQIFSSAPKPLTAMEDAPADSKKIGFVQAAGLQLVNPKTWMMAIAVVSVFADTCGDKTLHVIVLSLVFFLIAIPCLCLWAFMGASVSRWLDSTVRVRWFNRLMAVLLLLSAWLSLL